MNWLMKWGVKKWALGFVNDLLDKYRDNVQAALVVINSCIVKAEAVLAYLKSVRDKMSDNKIDDGEADLIVEEGEKLIGELVK